MPPVGRWAVRCSLLAPALALATALGACTVVDTSIYDPFPIPVDVDGDGDGGVGGVVILGARSTDLDPSGAVHRAVLDTGSAFTIFDVGGATGITRGRATVEMLAATTNVPRAQFDAVAALLSPTGSVGTGSPDAIQAILGADVLIQHALRIDVTDRLLRITPDVAADDTTLADSCQGSFSTPLAGGGSFQLGADSVRYPATRLVWSVCLAPPFDCALDGACDGGTDTLLLVSTAVRPIVLSRTTFERMTSTTDADVDLLPTTTMYFPGDLRPGGVTVHESSVFGFAIADRGNHGDDNPARGACLEYRASRIMDPTSAIPGTTNGGCTAAMAQSSSDTMPALCPCRNGATACAVGPSLESHRDLRVVILDDTDPVLQGLREELRPNLGDVSGFIGVEALAGLVVDVDYPHGRTVATCSPSDTTCLVRPAISGGSPDDVRSRASDLQAGDCFPGSSP